ncbi:MAG: PilZ domain-containing protein [Proteobacteria bacterium]|nr:PilZ domain-containing protein [Pseudomonadota bacterium]
MTKAGNRQHASEGPGSGRRSGKRVTLNLEFDSFDAFIQEYVTNISRTGVFIRSKRPLPVGSQVELHFSIIAGAVESIQGVGRVVRQEPEGMGVVFTQLSHYSQKLVERLLTCQPDQAGP